MAVNPVVTQANKGKLVTSTGFGGYDYCVNPYVGCQFGCTYCYVRFFIKDKNEKWGDFVRTRDHMRTKIDKDLQYIAAGERLVIGTMTDPYQPIERKYRLTRTLLEAIKKAPKPPKSVGLFTRSPIVMDDLQLIKDTDTRIHITITPYDLDVLTRIEPIAIGINKRFWIAQALVNAGVKVHISVSPVMPYSDKHIKTFAKKIANICPTGFTVDPMQAYGEAFDATDAALQGDPDWPAIRKLIKDKKAWKAWKQQHGADWIAEWQQYKHLPVFAISMDHQKQTRINMVTGAKFDHKDFDY